MRYKALLSIIALAGLLISPTQVSAKVSVGPGIYDEGDALPTAEVIDGRAKIRKYCPNQTGNSYCVKVRVDQGWIRSCMRGDNGVSFIYKLYSKSGRNLGTFQDQSEYSFYNAYTKNTMKVLYSYPRVPKNLAFVTRAKVIRAFCILT